MTTASQTINRLGGRQKGGALADQRITTCKLCLHSVLIGEPTVWLTKPMGLSHESCAAAAGLVVA